MLSEVAKKTLLSVDDVNLWLGHLKLTDNVEQQKRQTRKNRKQAQQQQAPQTVEYRCGICGARYEDTTDEEELWIECETCTHWFHAKCVGIDYDSVPETFTCSSCQ